MYYTFIIIIIYANDLSSGKINLIKKFKNIEYNSCPFSSARDTTYYYFKSERDTISHFQKMFHDRRRFSRKRREFCRKYVRSTFWYVISSKSFTISSKNSENFKYLYRSLSSRFLRTYG